MIPDDDRIAEEHHFEEVDLEQPGSVTEHLKLADLKNVRLKITADLGRCNMLVRDILELEKGSIIPLDKLAGEMTDMYVNKRYFARAEVVVIGDSLHVRIGEVVGGSGELTDSPEAIPHDL